MGSSTDPLGLVGTTIADKYEVVEVAAAGGFSVVYRANDVVRQQPVALKVFNVLDSVAPELCDKLLADFVQEGKLVSELCARSNAIVRAHDTGKIQISEDDWLPYLVLEWLDGVPLEVVLARENKARLTSRSLQEAIALLEPVATALDVAHCSNVAHRDLKPANIMIQGDARTPGALVKVLDFGIAKVMAEQEQLQAQLLLTGKKVTAFTPKYGAPEQFSRSFGATGPWTDVYAMALILEELMQGERVLQGDTYYELGTASSNESMRPTPRALGLAVSAEVEKVFTKALAVHPKDRYPSMASFWSELHAQAFPAEERWRTVGDEPASQPDPSDEAEDNAAPSEPADREDRASPAPAPAPSDSTAGKSRGGKTIVLVVAVVLLLAATLVLLSRNC